MAGPKIDSPDVGPINGIEGSHLDDDPLFWLRLSTRIRFTRSRRDSPELTLCRELPLDTIVDPTSTSLHAVDLNRSPIDFL